MWRPQSNVVVLAGCQALYQATAAIALTVGGLVGQVLAPDKAYATVPLALVTVMMATVTVPAALIMARRGRRAGFALGSIAGAIGGTFSAYAIFVRSFGLFCLGMALLGAYQAFGQYHRFAAADAVPKENKSQAISYVLLGGLVAALAGPMLASWARALFSSVPFAGSYFAVGVLAVLYCALVRLLQIAPLKASDFARPPQPLRRLVMYRPFLVAVTLGAVAQAAMMFVMTATPLAVIGCGLSVLATATIIQWHLVGMFAPSFVTGTLIKRFGVECVSLAGALLMFASFFIALDGITYTHFLVALTVQGVGWNFMFVGSTSLITTSYEPQDQLRVQGVYQFLSFGVVTVAASLSGLVFDRFGWDILNYLVIPFALVAVAVAAWNAAFPSKTSAKTA